MQFARSAMEGCQKTYALKFFLKEKDFESEKSIYRNSPIGKLLPMLAGLVEDGQLSDPDGHALPPCIIMERGESLNEWCQRRKPDIWGVMPVRYYFQCNVGFFSCNELIALHVCSFLKQSMRHVGLGSIPRTNYSKIRRRWTNHKSDYSKKLHVVDRCAVCRFSQTLRKGWRTSMRRGMRTGT